MFSVAATATVLLVLAGCGSDKQDPRPNRVAECISSLWDEYATGSTNPGGCRTEP